MMFCGVIGKLGALFVTIPNPVIGGVLMVMFGTFYKENPSFIFGIIFAEHSGIFGNLVLFNAESLRAW